MKFNPKEISLCHQVAEKYRKRIDDGDWYLRYDYDEPDVYLEGMDDDKAVAKSIPLWTISDCLEFLQEKEDVIELVVTGKHLRWFFRWENRKMRSGKTPLEACLKAVLAVLDSK